MGNNIINSDPGDNSMIINYKFNYLEKESEIRLFSDKFVNNNISNCTLLIDEKEYELFPKLILKLRDKLKVKLIGKKCF